MELLWTWDIKLSKYVRNLLGRVYVFSLGKGYKLRKIYMLITYIWIAVYDYSLKKWNINRSA